MCGDKHVRDLCRDSKKFGNDRRQTSIVLLERDGKTFDDTAARRLHSTGFVCIQKMETENRAYTEKPIWNADYICQYFYIYHWLCSKRNL